MCPWGSFTWLCQGQTGSFDCTPGAISNPEMFCGLDLLPKIQIIHSKHEWLFTPYDSDLISMDSFCFLWNGVQMHL